jgi:hypothetical protein
VQTVRNEYSFGRSGVQDALVHVVEFRKGGSLVSITHWRAFGWVNTSFRQCSVAVEANRRQYCLSIGSRVLWSRGISAYLHMAYAEWRVER